MALTKRTSIRQSCRFTSKCTRPLRGLLLLLRVKVIKFLGKFETHTRTYTVRRAFRASFSYGFASGVEEGGLTVPTSRLVKLNASILQATCHLAKEEVTAQYRIYWSGSNSRSFYCLREIRDWPITFALDRVQFPILTRF